MKKIALLIFLSSTISFCMEPEHRPLLKQNSFDDIGIPIKQEPKAEIPALKRLAAKCIAEYYTKFDTESLNTLHNLPQDYKDLIYDEFPLTKDNVWEIFIENKKREKECEQFLVKYYQFESSYWPITVVQVDQEVFKKRNNKFYETKYNEDFFYKKIEKDLEQKTLNPQLKDKIKTIAQQCALKFNEDFREALEIEKQHKESFFSVFPTRKTNNNPIVKILNLTNFFVMLPCLISSVAFLGNFVIRLL